MSISSAISTYIRVTSNVFSDPKFGLIGGSGAFKASVLEEELKRIVRDATGNGDEKLLENKPDDVPCKV